MLTYLLELTICWTLLYGVFYLCMRRETFFKINRWYLLTAILLGLVIPLLRFIPMMEEVELYNRQIAEYAPIVYVIKDAPAIVAHSITEQSIQWGQVFQFGLLALYALGFTFFLFRFIKGLTSIRRLYQEGEKSLAKNHILINTSGNHLPFSFLNMIFVSKDLPLNEDYNRIITHELEHVRSMHSIDVLLLEIINIVFWFHPMIYLYKSALRQTHEYLADAAVCGNDSRQHYGQLLLRQSLSGLEIALAHHFFHSHIKKRINMIYQEKSGRKAWLKYALAVPALALLMLVFTSQTMTDSEEKQDDQTEINSSTTDLESDNLLSKKQKERLRNEILKVFKEELEQTTLEKESLLTIIQDKWNKKYPKKKGSIHGTISFTLFKENMILVGSGGKIKIKPLPMWLPNRQAIETHDMLSPNLPDIQELLNTTKRRQTSVEITVIRKYLQFQSYYSKGGQIQDEILELFEQCLKEKDIQLGFELKDIRLEFNVTAPKLIKDYINSKDDSALPIFWGQSIITSAPHNTQVDLNYQIGFFAYITPAQAKTIFGSEGRNGIIAVSNYTLSPEHPEIHTERLTRDIENFFSTINQLPAKNWANKLKEVSHSLKSKYPNAGDFITPYSSIAQQHNITLVFKEGEIIKAYRGDGNSTERIDTDSKAKFSNAKTNTDTLSPIQRANLESSNRIDTIISHNPETFEETVQIRYSNDLPSFPGTINKKNRSYGYDGPVNVDTATIFDPVTFEESYVITTYPSHLSSDAPSVEIANFKYKIDKKNKLIYLSEITENISVGIISVEGNKNITFNKEIAASNTMTIDISAMPPGYYYISSLVGSVEVMKRIQIE